MDLDEEPVNNVEKTAENMDVDEPPTHIVNDLKLKLLSTVEDSRPGTPVEGSFTSTPTSSQTPQSINPCVRLLAKAVLQVLLVLLLLSFQLKCSSNIDSIHYLGLTNSFDQVPRNIHTLPSIIVNFLLNSLNAPITFVVCATNQS